MSKIYLKRLFFAVNLIIASGCGEIVSTLEYSSIKGANLSWSSVQNISATNIGSYSVSGRCVPQFNDVTVSIGNPVLSQTVLTCLNGLFNGVIDLSTSSLPEGSIEVSATQVNLTADAFAQVVVDTILPMAPTIVTPVNGSSTGSVLQSVSGACETGSTVNLSGDFLGSPVSVTCASSAYVRMVTLTSGNGSKTVVASQTDFVGNVSPTASSTITLGILPLAPTISSPISGSFTNTTSQTVIGTCETGATVNLSGNILGSPVTTLCAASAYSQAVTLNGGQGLNTISLTQTNAAGTSPTASLNLTLDSTAPVAPTITSPINNSFTNTTSQTILGACETGATVNINGALVGAPLTATCVASAYSLAVTLTAANGSKSISATQTDAALNTSPATNISITYDNVVPLAPTITSPLNGSSTNSTAQTILGACETGATVNISGAIVGSPVSASCVASSYSRAVTLNTGDGVKAVSATQTDLSNNISAATNISVTLDTGVPAAPTITSPTNGSSTNSSAQTVVGACETGATVNISGAIVGSPVTTSCVASNYSRAVTLTAGDGAKAISATQTDLSNNTSSATNISITLDTAVPTAPTITSPTNGSLVAVVAQTVTGACETGATVNISGDIVGSPVTTLCAASSYSRAVTLTAADGAKSISATQTDVALNISPATNISITLDTGAPLAPTITSPTNGSSTNATAQTVIGACENGATVNISGNIVGSPVTTACLASNYMRAVTLTAGDGSKTISATQTDVALNISPATNISITLDTTAPLAPTITSPANGSTVAVVSQTILGACETGSTVNISGGILGSPVTASCVASSYSRAVTLTAGDGAKAISATQTDAVSNISPATNISITLDTTAPAAPTITSPTNGSTTNTTSQTIIGACETGATVNISGAIVGSPVTASCVASAYSRAVTLTAANGAKAISATQTDVALNTSAATNISITYDNVSPSAPTITSPANGSFTNTTAQTLIGTCETGATVNISGAIVGSPVTALCVASAYSRAVTLTAGDGAKAISATQTDVALNTSAATNISITLDTATPAAPTITSPANGSSVGVVAQTVIGACETGATVNISGDIVGSPVTTVCAGSSYSRAVTLTAGDGSKNISATQTDLASNISPATNITIILDSSLPIAPTITSPISGSFTNTTAQTIIGACETGSTVNISGAIVGSPVTASCVANAYSRAVTLTAGDGAKAISATQTDIALNTSPATNISITLDTTPPAAPTITSPTNGSSTNSTAQTIVGACETGATVNISGAIVGSPVTASCVASAYSRAVTLTAANGAKAISATQTDAALNTSAATNISITYDNVVPAAPTITSPTNGSSTNSTAQTIVGACETGATVNISGAIVGSPVTASCVASSYSRAVTLTAGDGSKAISATQTDLANNTSAAANISITLDTATPAAPTITSPTNGSSTNTTAQTIVGVCETGATVNISGAIVGSPVTASCVASSYSRAVTLTAANGAKAISATQTDAANNTSAATNISITYDNVVPAAPTITSPTNGSSTNTTAQTIVGACETGATVNISGAIVGSPVTASCVASAYSRAVTLTAGDGLKSISATQTDVALNTSAATNISITLDTVAPSAPTITSPTNGSSTNSTARTIVGACETGATVNISGAIIGSPVTASCVASSYSRAVTLTAGDGSKAISATQTDVALNTSAATNISITLDTATPAAPTIVSPANGSSTNTTAQTIVGACETGATVNISGAIVGSPVTASCVASAYSRAVTLTAGDGSKSISATQTDVALNTSAATNISITLDTATPAAPTITSPTNGSSTNTTAQTIVGACETGSTVNISGAIVGSPVTASCVASAYSRAVTLTAGDGAKAISATQTDVAFNTSAATNISITLDTAVPAAPTITAPANNSFSNLLTQTVTGSCEPGATVNLTGSFTPSPTTAVCTVSGNYSRAVTLTAANGAKAISATQTDLALNTSAATNISITYDNVVPAAPTITSPVNGSSTNTTAQTIVGTCETGATVNISGAIVGSPVTASCVASSYSRAVTLTAGDGLKSIGATQTDAANNTSAATNISITLDTATPTAPTITSPTNGSSTNTTAQTIIGACETGATVNISGAIVGSPVTASCVASSYSRAVTLTAGDGSKAISATQTDVALNTSVATNISITLDTATPAAPTITSPANGSYTNSTARTIIGACETGATVNISGAIVGSPVTASCVASSYSRAVTLTAGDGSKAISATQTDVALNTSAATNISITLDTVAPAAPTITTPANGSFVSTVSITITGGCTSGLPVDLTGSFTPSPVSVGCVASSYSRAVTLIAGDGVKTISATQTDLAGNVSAAANSSITLDTVNPAPPTITSPVNGITTSSASQTVTGACETGATLEIWGNLVGSPLFTTCTASAYSLAVTLTPAYGSKTINAQQTDQAGNLSTPPATVTINYTNLNVTYPASFTGPKYTPLNFPSAGIARTIISGTPTGYSIAPALPTGLTINATSGLIAGTPTVSDDAGKSYTITITDGSATITRNIFIRIAIPDYTWMGTTGDGLWSTALNWKAAAVPPTTAWVYFDNECLTSGFCNANINLNTQVQRVYMKPTYTGTITQNAGRTFQVGNRDSNGAVTDTWGKWEMDAGTFVGGNSSLTLERINIQGGTFTSTSGTLRLGSVYTWKDCDQVGPTWDGKGDKDCGFTLSATAIFNHNNGTLQMNSASTSTYTYVFIFWLDQPLNLANLIIENNSDGASTSFDGRKNNANATIFGLSKIINVTTSLDWRDGSLTLGEIRYQGLTATFRCDAVSNSDRCSDFQAQSTEWDQPENIQRTGVQVHTWLRFNRNDGSPQTYSFFGGAAAPGFIVDNPNGLNPNPQSGATYFRLGKLRMTNGTFRAPAGPTGRLSFGEGNNTRYASGGVASLGFEVQAGGGFDHNTGLVSFDAVSNNADNRVANAIKAPGTVYFWNMDLSIAGDYDLNDGPADDLLSVVIEPGTTAVIIQDLNIKNGRFESSRNMAAIVVERNLNLLCANPAQKNCYNISEEVRFRFEGNVNSNFSFAVGGPGYLLREEDIHIQKNLTTNRVILVGNGGHSPTNVLAPQFRVLQGVFDVGTYQFIHNNSFQNNGAVQCTVGTGYFQYLGAFSGTPIGGNQPLCYGP